MLSKNQIKHLKSLSSSKFRQKYNNFIAEGDKLAAEIIKSQTFEIEYIYALSDWVEANRDLPLLIKDKLVMIDKRSMDQISLLSTSSSVYVLLKKPKENNNLYLIKNRYAILLDGVQDPGNVGTIIRIADWFGIPTVITNNKSADPLHPKVVQSSMGSVCHVNLLRLNDEEISKLVGENETYALTLDGIPISDDTFSKPGIIIMGSEGKGVSEDLLSGVGNKIFIPGAEYKGAESLNVSIATGIIGHHILAHSKNRT